MDTTGAGDCFNVGFLHQRLEGGSLTECLAAGVVCGAAAVTGAGSSTALNAASLKMWLSRLDS